MELTEVLKTMHETHSAESSKIFADLFRDLSANNTQVYTSAKPSGTGYAIDTASYMGNVYCVMYSDSSFAGRENGSKLCKIGICDLINACYANPHLMGICIDPGAQFPVYIQRKDLQILSGKPDPRLQPRNWGEGIPQYSETDLMVAEEGLEFAMEIAAKYGLAEEGYEVIETNNGLTAFPNFVCRKGSQLYFVAVDAALAPKMPSLDPETVPKLLAIAEENNAKVLYAPVSFCSSDTKRMEAGLALVGDSFIGNFAGFLPLN